MDYASAMFSKIAAGQRHTCGILDGQNNQTEGEVVCWGDVTPVEAFAREHVGYRLARPDYPYPENADGPSVTSGLYFNCALSERNDIVCWGGDFAALPYVALQIRRSRMGSLVRVDHGRQRGLLGLKQLAVGIFA